MGMRPTMDPTEKKNRLLDQLDKFKDISIQDLMRELEPGTNVIIPQMPEFQIQDNETFADKAQKRANYLAEQELILKQRMWNT